jgi:hypothetical protein
MRPSKASVHGIRLRPLCLPRTWARHGDLEILIPSTYGGELAAAKTRTDRPTKPRWKRETFLDAIATDADRRIAARYFKLVESRPERHGPSALVWYGNRPSGGIFLHPYGLRYAPFRLWVDSEGRLMIYGNWNNWQAVAGHDGFAELATMLGQDHRGGFTGCVVASVSTGASSAAGEPYHGDHGRASTGQGVVSAPGWE